MTFSLMSWILGAWLVVTCLSMAVPVWKRAGMPSGPSRRSLLAGLMEAASLAGLLRLVVPWTSGSVVLWVVAVVALAAAVAGAVLRWPELPGRVESEGPLREKVSEATTGPEPAGSELVPNPDIPAEASDQSRLPQTAASQAASVERSRLPFFPVRERAAAPGTGNSDTASPDHGSPDRKAKAGKKKPKKEPGNLALAGNAALLLGVVVVSFLAG
ncbi:hypothetical protein [Arthrobacter sp. zg-Y1171]|uniref:hypothetical protein n=1 Tax=Arthrobacter sp. zg-Y1171 TaxID=2964610 RepID=UPI002106DB73|nr:hypothetical protein [Arthrobacter sp. zg-Y1171]MCQ1995153.1 hypothetical protein [Arthrobacter sp. zg-Y1171]UWX80802.1 hypothetical protein N2L00_10230 [Arthrobacter sp. zg-Y1171]